MHCDYKTRDQARVSLFDYMEVFYNRQRRHPTINSVAPLASLRGINHRLIRLTTVRWYITIGQERSDGKNVELGLTARSAREPKRPLRRRRTRHSTAISARRAATASLRPRGRAATGGW